MSSKLRLFGMLIPVLTLLLAACAAAPTATPASSVSSQPTTAPADTSTPASAPASTDTAMPASPTNAASSPAPASSTSSGIQFVLVPAKSEASYSVREQLARLNAPSDAVGKTNAFSGSITLNPDGTVDKANSKFVIDASTLQTDEGMRDNYVRGRILQTSQYPQITFVPTQISGLSMPLPQSGNVSFKLAGDLTIRDVTRSVTFDVTGSIKDGEATGTAITSFTFEDFNLSQPNISVVLSVVDKITLNLTLDLQAAK